MKDFKYIWLLLLLILNSFGACSDDDPLMPGERPSSGTDPAPEEHRRQREGEPSSKVLPSISSFFFPTVLKRMNH